MEQHDIERLKHYCNMLHLNSYDTKDILDYISKHEAYKNGMCSQQDYGIILNKIKRLELVHIVTSFENYLNKEKVLYQQLHEKDPYNGKEIWDSVFKQIDNEIQTEILYAKQASAHVTTNNVKNIGCFLLIIAFCVLLFVGITKIF